VPTGRCLVLVSADGQRTMNTFLGAAQFLPSTALDEVQIRSAAVLLLEGYLWDPIEPRKAMQAAIRIAHDAGRKVALGVSASFCIMNHHSDFTAMVEDGSIDILFANDEEVQTLAGIEDFEAAVAKIAAFVPLLVVTRGAEGAIAVENGSTRYFGAGRAGRADRRHHRRRRPVRGRIPGGPGAGPVDPGFAHHGRGRGRRSDLALRRPPGSRPEGAGRPAPRLNVPPGQPGGTPIQA
jgi:hypothetical protein